MIEPIALLVSLAVGIGWYVREHRRETGPLPRGAARDAFEREWAAENPPGPPLTDAEIDERVAALDALARPAAQLVPVEGAVGPAGTRLGGPVWLEDGEAWPAARNGDPAIFLAQIDFAELPPLTDFPEAGLLQLFLASDDLHGMDLRHFERPDIVVRWRPEGFAEPVRHDPVVEYPGLETTPLSEAATHHGVPLRAVPIAMAPDAVSFEVTDALRGLANRAGFDRLETHAEETGPLAHSVGGHPRFVQDDPRHDPALRSYDCVLLHLTSDAHVQWGDVGEANFLIRREDLVARRFDRLLFTWDCS